MRFLSICSGIEAASVAWHPLGWTAAAFAEVDAFPSAVLAHRFPEVRNRGDFTRITADDVGAIDLLVGGTPCQSFSVAGKRAGLDDPRGVLAFEFIRLAQRTRPRWVVFENVPGLLSSRGGADFGDWLTALAECGYGWAYRVLDAQHFGVPQRRRRVFVVGYLGDWRPPAAVLLEPESMRGDPPPRRDTGKAAPTIPARRTAGGGLGTDFDCDGGLIAHALRAEGCDASEDGTGRGTPLVVAPALTAQEGKGPDSDATTTLVVSDPTSANEGRTYSREGRNNFRLHNVIPFDAPEPAFIHVNKGRPAGRQSAHEEMVTVKPLVETIATDGHSRSAVITFDETQITSPLNRSVPKPGDPSHPIPAHGRPPSLATVAFVRRLTPRECERLQGFPDDWTLVPYRGKQAADGPRYRAIGNSMATPVMRWIGERIALCERALSAREVAA